MSPSDLKEVIHRLTLSTLSATDQKIAFPSIQKENSRGPSVECSLFFLGGGGVLEVCISSWQRPFVIFAVIGPKRTHMNGFGTLKPARAAVWKPRRCFQLVDAASDDDISGSVVSFLCIILNLTEHPSRLGDGKAATGSYQLSLCLRHGENITLEQDAWNVAWFFFLFFFPRGAAAGGRGGGYNFQPSLCHK